MARRRAPNIGSEFLPFLLSPLKMVKGFKATSSKQVLQIIMQKMLNQTRRNQKRPRKIINNNREKSSYQVAEETAPPKGPGSNPRST
jgi:hypothetical protein